MLLGGLEAVAKVTQHAGLDVVAEAGGLLEEAHDLVGALDESGAVLGGRVGVLGGLCGLLGLLHGAEVLHGQLQDIGLL